MTSDDLKTPRAVLWSRRFSLLYAMGVWTIIGYFVSRSVRFREIPLEEKEKGGQSPPPPPPVGEEQISSIGHGICVLLGISVEDTQKELEHMVRKILNLRVFEDESGKHWSKSVMDKQYEVLCVSQFTLQCILKGNKPDYHMAMPSDQAESFYNGFLEHLRKAYKPELIKDGKFGEYMQVHIQNDGPVTIELESPTAPVDSKQLAKLEKQQQRKEKTRMKVPSESSRERNLPKSKNDPSASSGAEGDVSSEREP